jgi:hypothetical protein
MESFNEDDVFLDAVDDLVLAALHAIGKDPAARFALFKDLLAAARDATARYSPNRLQ